MCNKKYIAVHGEYSTKAMATPQGALDQFSAEIGSEDEECLEVWEVTRKMKKIISFEGEE